MVSGTGNAAPATESVQIRQTPDEIETPDIPKNKTVVAPSLPVPPGKAAPKDDRRKVARLDGVGADLRRESPRRPQKAARLALIIDDVGISAAQLEPFLDLPADLTFAIIPETRHARRCLTMIRNKGRLPLLHLPMEPMRRTELLPSNAITVKLSGDEIERRVGKFLTELQGVRGVNNHMGSKATQDERVMESVLSVVKSRGLFFVDSKTAHETVVAKVAGELGVPHAERTGEFLDDGGNTSRAYQIVLDLGREAQRTGTAIGIGHPHTGTYRAIARALPELEAMGVQIVPVSELTR